MIVMKMQPTTYKKWANSIYWTFKKQLQWWFNNEFKCSLFKFKYIFIYKE